jgi:hypothetical protein
MYLQCLRGDDFSRATGRKLILVWSFRFLDENGIPDARAHVNCFEFEFVMSKRG